MASNKAEQNHKNYDRAYLLSFSNFNDCDPVLADCLKKYYLDKASLLPEIPFPQSPTQLKTTSSPYKSPYRTTTTSHNRTTPVKQRYVTKDSLPSTPNLMPVKKALQKKKNLKSRNNMNTSNNNHQQRSPASSYNNDITPNSTPSSTPNKNQRYGTNNHTTLNSTLNSTTPNNNIPSKNQRYVKRDSMPSTASSSTLLSPTSNVISGTTPNKNQRYGTRDSLPSTTPMGSTVNVTGGTTPNKNQRYVTRESLASTSPSKNPTTSPNKNQRYVVKDSVHSTSSSLASTSGKTYTTNSPYKGQRYTTKDVTPRTPTTTSTLTPQHKKTQRYVTKDSLVASTSNTSQPNTTHSSITTPPITSQQHQKQRQKQQNSTSSPSSPLLQKRRNQQKYVMKESLVSSSTSSLTSIPSSNNSTVNTSNLPVPQQEEKQQKYVVAKDKISSTCPVVVQQKKSGPVPNRTINATTTPQKRVPTTFTTQHSSAPTTPINKKPINHAIPASTTPNQKARVPLGSIKTTTTTPLRNQHPISMVQPPSKYDIKENVIKQQTKSVMPKTTTVINFSKKNSLDNTSTRVFNPNKMSEFNTMISVNCGNNINKNSIPRVGTQLSGRPSSQVVGVTTENGVTQPSQGIVNGNSNMDQSPNSPFETDGRRLSQRQKQIEYGYKTLGYQRYILEVPKSARLVGYPNTPRKSQQCSKRSWDGQIRKWRRELHKWDPSHPSEVEYLNNILIKKYGDNALLDLSPLSSPIISPIISTAATDQESSFRNPSTPKDFSASRTLVF